MVQARIASLVACAAAVGRPPLFPGNEFVLVNMDDLQQFARN